MSWQVNSYFCEQELIKLNFETVFVIHYSNYYSNTYNQGPVVQSIVSLTSSLVVKILAVLVSTISNSQVFLLKKKK